jgi:ribonuclease BN (tRNA processing enzyme)
MLSEIKRASSAGLVFCFAGVGSAFSKKHAQTSLIIAKNGQTVLVDIGNTIPRALWQQGIGLADFDFYHFTHSHADHIGGVEELLLLSRYTQKPKPKFVITEAYQDMLWRRSLSGGCEYNEDGLLRFSDLMVPVRPNWTRSEPREMYEITVGDTHLLIFRTKHIPGDVVRWEQAFWSTGLLVDGRILFTADTRFDPKIFTDLESSGYPTSQIEAIFHDCQLSGPGTVHATFEELQTLSDDLKEKMWLTHYGDNFEAFEPQSLGFRGFAQEWEIYDFS